MAVTPVVQVVTSGNLSGHVPTALTSHNWFGVNKATGQLYAWDNGWEALPFYFPPDIENINVTGILSVGDEAGVEGIVEMARFGGGKIKLTFKGGIVTEIEDEA